MTCLETGAQGRELLSLLCAVISRIALYSLLFFSPVNHALYLSSPILYLITTRALQIEDPSERLLQLTRWVFSGHHTRPKGVKKPFNPILGEFFRCEWKEQDGSTGFYICEQVSHHPPQSAFFYANPTHKIYIVGNLRPHARFLGNSAGTMMDGGSTIYLGDDEYYLTNPNVYARSILFGKMFMELGDTCVISSKKHNIECSLEFKQKVVALSIGYSLT